MPVTRKHHFEHTVTIEDQPVRLIIKRLTVPEFEAFQAKFIAMGQGRGAPVSAEGSSQTPEQVDAQVAYLKANAEWLQDTFNDYVAVTPGDLCDEDADGFSIPVTNGKQFADMYAGTPIPAQVLARIYLENVLTEAQKKTLRSASDSVNGSTIEPATAAAGETPAPTAASAEPEASANVAAATEPSNEASSGTTVPSSSEAVPCAT